MQLTDDDKNQELAKLIESLNAYCATGGEEVHETSGSEVPWELCNTIYDVMMMSSSLLKGVWCSLYC